MADYTIRIVSDSGSADKDLERLEKRARELEKKPFKLNVQLPTLDQTIQGVQTLGSALQTTYGIARNIVPQIRDIEELGGVIQGLGQKAKVTLDILSKSTPATILGTAFNAAAAGAEQATLSMSRLGFVVFGLTQSVNLLKSTYAGFFNETIGREIRLQETLLKSKTTLLATNNILRDGVKIANPTEALQALNKPIEDTIASIRRKSLDIAGTTSEAIIQTFGIVSSQIGSIGGDLKDAENLALSFAAALGTIGLADPAFAAQEVGSILRGDINPDSILARSLNISNADIAKAKQNGELIGFITKKLEAFTVGQKIASTSFSGLTSNIQEFNEELGRSFGKPLLEPLLQGLDAVYERITNITKPALEVAEGLGRAGAALASGIGNGISQAPAVEGFDSSMQLEAVTKLNTEVTRLFLFIQEQIDKMQPTISALVDNVVIGIASIGDGIVELAKGFALFKFEEFKLALSIAVDIGQTLNATVIPALNTILKIYGQILSQPIVQYMSQFIAQMGLLERVGVLPLARLLFFLPGIINSVKQVTGWFGALAAMVGGAVKTAFNSVAGGIANVGTVLATLGRTAVVAVSNGLQLIARGLMSIITQMGVLLINAADAIQVMYPQLMQVGAAINNIGLAFLNVGAAVEMFQVKAGQATLKVIATLDQLELQTQQVKQKFVELGATINAQMAKAGAAVGGFVKAQLVGLLVFGIQMVAINLLITTAVDQWGRFQRRQDEIAKSDRTQLALKRLATTFRDVGEESSFAARKGKEFEEQLLAARYDEITKRLEELRVTTQKLNKDMSTPGVGSFNEAKTAYEAYFRELAAFAKANPIKVVLAIAAPSNIAQFFVDFFGNLFKGDFIGKEQKRQLTEAEKEAAALRAEAAEINRREDIKNLNERITLESQRRTDIAKQLAEFERNHRNAMFQLEQQSGERRIQVFRLEEQLRIDAMVMQNEKLIEGQQGLSKTILDNLNNYIQQKENGELEIEASKQSMVLELQVLEKSIADYKWETEKRTAELRKQVGDYERKMAQYKLDMAVLEGKARSGTPPESGGASVTGRAGISDIADTSLNANTRAWLATIRFAEGTSGPNGYRTMFGGGLFNDMSRHPDRVIRKGGYASAAAGAYQFMPDTWNMIGGGSFDPVRQDKGAVALGLRRGVDFRTAAPTNENLAKLAPEWASLPTLSGASYHNQPVKNANTLREVFNKNLMAASSNVNTVPGRRIGQVDTLGGRQVMWDGSNYVPISGGATGAPTAPPSAPTPPPFPDLEAISSNAIGEQQGKIQTAMDQVRQLQKLQAQLTQARSARQFESIIKSSVQMPDFDQLDTELIRLQVTSESVGSALDKAFDPIKQGYLVDLTVKAQVFEGVMANIRKILNNPDFKIDRKDPARDAALKAALERQIQFAEQVNTANLDKEYLSRIRNEDAARGVRTQQKLVSDGRSASNDIERELLTLRGRLAATMIDADDPMQTRMFDAQQQILQKELEIRQDQSLSIEQATKQLDEFKQIVMGGAIEMARLDTVMKATQERLALVREISGTISDGFKSVFATLVQGGDIGAALSNMGKELAERVLTRFTDFAFKPLEDQMEEMFKKLFGMDDPQVTAQTDNTLAIKDNTAALRAANNIVPGPQGVSDSFASAFSPGVQTNLSGFQPFNPSAPGNANFTGLPDFSAMEGINAELEKLSKISLDIPGALTKVDTNFTDLGLTLSDTSSAAVKAQGSFQNVVGGVATMAASIAGIAAGIGQIGKGGTGNVLGGIGSIFMGLSGAITGFNGIFGGFRAKGGDAKRNRGYIVGEDGPEWFEPDQDGQVISNRDVAFLARRSRNATMQSMTLNNLRQKMDGPGMSSGSTMTAFNFKFETTQFGGDEWISRSQVEQMMEETRKVSIKEGSRQGLAMTLDKLQNSSATRRRVGL